MLSIGRVGTGGGLYYSSQVAAGAEDYYLGAGEAPGYWTGSGLAGLELQAGAAVDGEAFKQVLAGCHPTSDVALVPSVEGRVEALDLTFSAPKSVSLLWALHSDAQVRRAVAEVADAHQEAIGDAVGFLEADALRARRGRNGLQRVRVDGMVAAAFGHRTSRTGDPHLHTHVVAANLVRDSTGRWSAFDTRAVYRHARTAGFIYQASLRARLTQTLGVEWGPVRTGQADLAGLTRTELEVFSTRRADIAAALAERRLTSAHAARIAVLDTRPAKPDLAASSGLFERWQQTAAERGLAVDSLTGLGRTPQVPAGIAAQLCGRHGLTAQASSFDRRDLLRGLAHAHPQGAIFAQLETAAARLVETEGVVELTPAGADNAQRRWTTVELLAAEAELIRLAERASERRAGIADPAAVTAALRQRPQLSGEQAATVGGLCRAEAGIVCVVGKAGSGKTFALDAARAAWNNSGVPVVGAALSARAAAELQAGSGIASTTLARLAADLHHPQSRPAYGSVIVIDEAGMVGTRQLHQLATAASAYHWKLVLVGDPRQLPEIDAGGSFARLTARTPTWTLAENRRQTNTWERQALDQLRDRQPAPAVNAYHRHGRVTIAHTAPAMVDAMIADWHAARLNGQQVVMLAGRRWQVEQLNTAAQTALVTAGTLDPATAIDLDRTRYMVGDQVICTRNDRRAGLINGQQATITSTDPDRPHLQAVGADGQPVPIPWAYAHAGRLQLGYAMTIHKAQGVTVDVALLAGDDRLFNEAGYVGLSRGRHTNHIYTVAQADPTPARQIDWNRRDIDQLVAALGVTAAQTISTDRQPADPTLNSWTLKQLVHEQDRLLHTIRADRPADPTRWLIAIEETRRIQHDNPYLSPAGHTARHQLQNDTAHAAWALAQHTQWQAGHRRDGQQLAAITATIDTRLDQIHQTNLASPPDDLVELLVPAPDHPLDRQRWARTADQISLWAQVTGQPPHQLTPIIHAGG